ncbi:TolC family protein [Caminibacter sp.]
MKKTLLFIPFFLYAGILSNLKEKEFNLDKLKSIKDSKITKYSWINPIMLQYSLSRDNTQKVITTTQNISISVNQPIFKSGAIYYSIKYANLSKSYNIDRIELQKRALIKQALDLAYDYKINDLNEKILKYQLANADITVKRKKEAFLSGTGDSSDLDNAILNLNSIKLSLYDVKIAKNDLKYSFKNISDLNISDVKLPVFKIINKNQFLNQNLDLQAQKKYKKISFYLYKMQAGDQLITVSLNGSYNYQQVDNDNMHSKSNFYTYGFSISMPLDINSKRKIESSKINYLKSSLLQIDKRYTLINLFNQIMSDINYMKQKIKIYNQNIKIYNNLIKTTLESIKAGSATEDDLKILENSKMTLVINKKILKLQIQKKLLNLYYNLTSFLY